MISFLIVASIITVTKTVFFGALVTLPCAAALQAALRHGLCLTPISNERIALSSPFLAVDENESASLDACSTFGPEKGRTVRLQKTYRFNFAWLKIPKPKPMHAANRLRKLQHLKRLWSILIALANFSPFQVFVVTLVCSVVAKPVSLNSKLNDMEKIKLSSDQLKNVENMHYSWYLSATNALLGAVGRELYVRMNRENRRAFIRCLDHIKTETDVQAGAKCITAAIDNRLIKPTYGSRTTSFLQESGTDTTPSLSDTETFYQEFDAEENNSVPRYKKILNWSTAIKPIIFKEKLRKLRMNTKNTRRRLMKRHNTFRIDGQLNELMEESRRIDSMDPDFKIVKMDNAPSLIDPHEEKVRLSKSPIWTTSKMLTNFIRVFTKKTPTKTLPWKETYKKLEKVQDAIEESRYKSKYRHRMLDMVLGENNRYKKRMPLTDRIQGYLPERIQKAPLMKKLVNVLDAFSKHNNENAYKLLSPRFLPVVPDTKQISHALSPDLFPIYNDDSPNSILPIPKMLKATGMTDDDRDAVLELIMHSSGAKTIVDETLETLEKAKEFGLADDITNITIYIRDLFNQLEKSLNPRQKREIKSRKYSFLTKDQLLTLFGTDGLYNTTNFPFDIDEYASWTEVDKKKALYNKIRILAGEVQEPDKHSRRKRQIALSPFAFAPSVLGIGNPMIFSPYFLGPNTLSAAIFNVYVFTPYILSPNIMNPYIMSPLILSPYVLSPDLISPTILSGGILSPGILSPSVLSPTAFAATVLSPSVLS